MSKEYPMDRKLQKAEDEERMSRILKRRAGDETGPRKTNTPQHDNSENSDQARDKARSATSGR